MHSSLYHYCEVHDKMNLISEWHPDKNAEITPHTITYASGKKVWWQCANGHEWKAIVANRLKGNGCPYCAGKWPVPGQNDLATVNPALAAQWHPIKNGSLTPCDLLPHSNKKVWWQCEKGHEWLAQPANRLRGDGCAVCAGKQIMKGSNDLATLHPDVAKQWHPTKNGALTPGDVTASSGKKVWWRCEKGHDWPACVSLRTARGTGCPYCAGKAVLKGFNDLATIDPKLAAQWHPTKNGALTPGDITASSGKKVWWRCEQNHTWLATADKRYRNRRGCPFCARRQVLAGYNDLASKAPLLAEQWHPTKNGALKPNEVTRSSGRRIWWRCPAGHEWQATPAQRDQHALCPECHTGTSFSEQAIYHYAKQLFPLCHNRFIFNGREIDIYLPDIPVRPSGSLSVGIEHDGPFHDEERVQEFDRHKEALLKAHGIYLIRIKMADKAKVNEAQATVYYQYDINDYSGLEQAIRQAFALISAKTGAEYPADINIDRDETAIYQQYRERIRGNSLFVKYPEAQEYWDHEKNKYIDPYYLSYGSGKKVWWQCKEGHSWKAKTANFTLGGRCPYCSNNRVIKGVNDLVTKRPELAKQWHPTYNGSLKPDQFTASAKKIVWWLCGKGHSWQASIAARTVGGCPYCSSHRAWKGFNDLATVNQALAAEWHPTKNGDLTPADVMGRSNKKVWWLCKNGHEWQAQINSRSLGIGCSRCSGRKVTKGENDIATTHPELVLEWHPAKNGTLTPHDVSRGSERKVWWLCQMGHEWQTAVYNRTQGRGCPICSGNQLLRGYNDLATTHPKLVLEWHPTKNADLTPSDVSKGTHRKVWWQCEKGHEWLAAVQARVAGTGCVFCAGKQVLAGYNDFASLQPKLAKQWHPVKNGDLAPTDVTVRSGKKVWWLCEKKHEWEATVDTRTNGVGCPVCSGKKVLIGFNDLATACPQLAAEWHPAKNGTRAPQSVTKGSKWKAWWQCGKGHEWQASVASRAKGAGCPYCAGKKILPGYNDLCTARPDLAHQWHPTKNGALNPHTIGKRSEKQVWWMCSQGHEWKTAVENRARGTGCPICAREKRRKGNDNPDPAKI